jgi:GNAT superfamily N-acetyltransferase
MRQVAATPDLWRRLERVNAEYKVRRYSGPGNPMGAEILEDDELIATKVPFARTNSMMNAVHGLSTATSLPRVLAHYASTDQPCWIHVMPDAETALTDALCREGFAPESYSTMLYATPVPAPIEHDVDIVEIRSDGLAEFLDTMNVGFGTPEAMLERLRRNQSFWPSVDEWHLLLARVGGEPAGAAMLSRHGNIAYLAAGATLPPFRNRGVQSALIAERLAIARRHGCELVTGQAAAGSQSQCNQQRAGLGIAATKTIWTNHKS